MNLNVSLSVSFISKPALVYRNQLMMVYRFGYKRGNPWPLSVQLNKILLENNQLELSFKMIFPKRLEILPLILLFSNLFLVVQSEWNNYDFLSQFENKSIEMIRLGGVIQQSQSRAASCADGKAGLRCNDCSSILVRFQSSLKFNSIKLYSLYSRCAMVLQTVLVTLFRVVT